MGIYIFIKAPVSAFFNLKAI